MQHFHRFWAVFKARNLEFFRDRAAMSWNLIFPILLLVGFSVIFSGEGRAVFKVGVIALAEQNSPFLQTKHIEFVAYQDLSKAQVKLSQHSIDFLIDFTQQQYWLNEQSANSYLVEKLFVGEHAKFQRLVTQGRAIRYVDWVLPGILAMNMMFSSLFGVGYVIVRYRKNSVLKRLRATPLSAFEFISAQLLSRLFIVMFMSTVVYLGCNMLFDFYMLGSYLNLLLVGVLGSFCLITLGLLLACRSKSEELVGGLLNLASWPMMMLSGVWFSLEGAPNALKLFAEFLPLTHLVTAGRKILIEGAGLADISYHLSVLLLMSLVFLLLGSYLFNWNSER